MPNVDVSTTTSGGASVGARSARAIRADGAAIVVLTSPTHPERSATTRPRHDPVDSGPPPGNSGRMALKCPSGTEGAGGNELYHRLELEIRVQL